MSKRILENDLGRNQFIFVTKENILNSNDIADFDREIEKVLDGK